MSEVIIKIEALSKVYKIGKAAPSSFRESLTESVKNIFVSNNRKNHQSEFWALKDVSFEIKRGEVVGIIGKNGAGKSTLLKILSRITDPTKGKIEINGRIASLLEVGTGFHPELSGRENIYLNGTLLGMTRKEVKKKFDEIVSFSGVEKFIDTPVKRYSSGMYVRLAFAVAAHLESEILIIDEVLAVGDDEFQKKCLGKMEDVADQGRTILFVSHNMPIMKQLCNRGILLQNSLIFDGTIEDTITEYLFRTSDLEMGAAEFKNKNNKDIAFTKIRVTDINGKATTKFNHDEKAVIWIDFEVNHESDTAEISVCLKNTSGINVIFSSINDRKEKLFNFKKGKYTARVTLEENFLMPDTYFVSIFAHIRNITNIDSYENVVRLNIEDNGSYMAPYGHKTYWGCVLWEPNWQVENSNIAVNK
jgi:lipopolysaccharide transport system ATP-binding protein